MTTQLPNGYEAVKVPEGAYDIRIHYWLLARRPKLLLWSHDFVYARGRVTLSNSNYTILGRADELTEEQCAMIVDASYEMADIFGVFYRDYAVQDYIPSVHGLFAALESFRSLLASLHLEPHTTIILKKENV